MTFVGILGMILGLFAFPFATRERTPLRVFVFLGLYVTQLVCAFYYFYWQQTNTTDSTLYYYDPYSFYGAGFGLNTTFVVYLVQFLREVIGGTYLDYFLLFQATGAWALALMMRTIEETCTEVGQRDSAMFYALLFLPTIHFFTSAIGKDGPLVLAAALAVWATMRIRQRLVAFGAAVAIAVLFRPHIGLAAAAAFAGCAFLDVHATPKMRVGLAIIGIGALAVIAGTVQSAFGVDVTSADSVGTFFERQSEAAQQFDTGTAVLNASFPVRLFSLLFRPFFFDADSAMALVASLENVVVLFVVGTLVLRWKDLVELAKKVFFIRFALMFGIMVILLLAFIYYNVGLGLRQRTMAFPSLVTCFAAVVVVRRARREVARPSYPLPA